jgi:methylmalonyl-CoA/ethylmalonyl-CoA epimerase
MSGAPPRVSGLEHVGIAVADVDAALEAFARLGFRRVSIEELPDQGVRSHLVETGGVYLELLEVVDPGSAVGRFMAGHGPGLHHVCLRVESLEDSTREFGAHGVRTTEPADDERGRRVFVHPSSAAGVLVGLVQPWA